MRIREMTWNDLDQVMSIENENFSVPWTETGFFTYLMRSDALFLVAEEENENAGFEDENCEEVDSETLESKDLGLKDLESEGLGLEEMRYEELVSENPEAEDLESEDFEYEDMEEEACGIILGYCGIIMAADEGDITNVSVKKEYQGQGIGSALVGELEARVKTLGIQKIFLEVRKSNASAIALYEKKGFEHMGIRKNYYSDPVEDAITMCRKLSL